MRLSTFQYVNFFWTHHVMDRSSRPEVFCKKGILQSFAKFTGKLLCQGLFYNRVTGLCHTVCLKNQ